MKKNLILSLFSLVVLTGCSNGKSLNSLSFSDRKKRATIIDEKTDKKQNIETVSREEIEDFTSYTTDGNIRYKSNENSTGSTKTYTILLISPSVTLSTSALERNSSNVGDGFNKSKCYFTFGLNHFIGINEGSADFSIYSTLTGKKLCNINRGSYRLESKSRNYYGIDFYKITKSTNHESYYFASYTDNDGNLKSEVINEEQYNSNSISGVVKNPVKYHHLYERGFNSENYVSDSSSRIFDKHLNRIGDRNSSAFPKKNTSLITGNGKLFYYGFEEYTSEKDSRNRYHAYSYELNLDSGKISYHDNLDFLVKNVYPVYESRKFDGKDYKVVTGSYLVYYPLGKEGIAETSKCQMAYVSDKLAIRKSNYCDSRIDYKKYLVNPSTIYLQSDSNCFVRRKDDNRTLLDNVNSIVSLNTTTILYKDKQGKYHECDHSSIVNDPSQSYDFISDFTFNGLRIRANKYGESKYHLNDGNAVSSDYLSYLNQGRVITDNRIYPFNQSTYVASFSGKNPSNVTCEEYSDIYDTQNHSKTVRYLYKVSLEDTSLFRSETHAYLVTRKYYYDED